MKTYNYLVYKDRIKPLAPQKGVSGNINYYECTFEFDSDWEGLAKTVVFVGENVCNAPIALNKCSVPIDVLEKSGEVYIGVYGFTKAEENSQVRISTNLIPFECEEGAYREGLPGSNVPPPDVWEIYQKAINDATEKAISDMNGIKTETETIKNDTATIKADTEKIKTATETIKTETETIKNDTEDIRVAAQDARINAETAQTNAEKARDAASGYNIKAEQAKNDAVDAASRAGASVSIADDVMNSAKASEEQASASATAAERHKNTAGDYALIAENAAKVAAESSDLAHGAMENAEESVNRILQEGESFVRNYGEQYINGQKTFVEKTILTEIGSYNAKLPIRASEIELEAYDGIGLKSTNGYPITFQVGKKTFYCYDNGEFGADRLYTKRLIIDEEEIDFSEFIKSGKEEILLNAITKMAFKVLDGELSFETRYGNKILFDGFGIHLTDGDAELFISREGVKVKGKPIATEEYVNEALKDVEGGSITIDDVPTEGSTNAVSSGGVFTAIQNVNKSDTTPVGTRVILPSKFTDAPIELYKNGTKYSAVHNFEQYRYGASLYVDHENGSDNGNGTKENPFKTLKKAMESITTDTNIIVKAKTPFGRGESATGYINEYNVSFYNANESKTPVIISTRQTGLSWTAEDNVFKTTRSNTKNILVKDSKDTTFGWRTMDKASSLDDCKANTGTCFVDGSTVYINTFDGLVPTEDKYMVCIVSGEIIFYPKDNTKLFFDGFTFVGCQGYDGILFSKTTNGEATATVVLKDCVAGQNQAYNDGATYSGNGFAFDNIKNVMLFNCTAKNCRRDGFNYHWSKSTNATECLVVEVDCVAKNCGLNDSTSNNNLTTAHNAGRCLRVNHYGRNCKGPMMTDVNGCKSLAFGCDISSKSSGYSYTFLLDNIGSAMMVDCKSSTGKAMVTDGVLYIDGFDGEIDSTTTVINI